jgi:outer membrane protein assembly factor BamB
MQTRILLSLILAASAFQTARASEAADLNWPAWRGPRANGVAPYAEPPLTWSETNNVRWKVRLPGRGTATPIVWNDQVFIQTAIAVGAVAPAAARPETPPAGTVGGAAPGGGLRVEKPGGPHQFVLLCLDRRTGQTLWKQVARETVPHEGHHGDHGFASYSPVTDGRLILSWFGSRGLHCYDLQGRKKWEKDLGRMQTRNSFGEGSSPALAGQTVVVNWDHEGDDFVAAFDKESGRELWRQPRDENSSWATPLVVAHGGQTQVVVSATSKVRSYDLATGKLIWECGGMTQNVIPSPVAGHGMVYPISGFRGSALLAIRLGRTGDLTDTDAIAWRVNRSTPYVPSPLLYENRLYFLGGNNGLLSCVDARTGKGLIDAVRLEALQGVYASPVGAAGRVYLAGRNGAVVVIKDSDALEVLATNRLDDKFDASPAATGKDLFLRGREFLYCLSAP